MQTYGGVQPLPEEGSGLGPGLGGFGRGRVEGAGVQGEARATKSHRRRFASARCLRQRGFAPSLLRLLFPVSGTQPCAKLSILSQLMIEAETFLLIFHTPAPRPPPPF